MMKIAMTLILSVSVAAAFADCCSNSGGCGSSVYKASALSKSDAEFLALANAMAMKAEGKASSCCASKKPAKKAKASKNAKAAVKACCAAKK